MSIIKSETKWVVCKHASEQLSVSIAKSISYEEMSAFHNKYNSIMSEYFKKYSILSTIEIERLDSAQEWFKEIRECKTVPVPLLVSKMLLGNFWALNIYNNVHKDQPELVLDYDRLHTDDALNARLSEYGDAEDDRARFTAEYWFSSQEAADLLGCNEDLHVSLCAIIQMLGVTNEFADCS